MAGETASIVLTRSIDLSEMEELYESERNRAALIHPKLVFRQSNDTRFEFAFHPKHRNWRNIDQYKPLVESAIKRRYPECKVI